VGPCKVFLFGLVFPLSLFHSSSYVEAFIGSAGAHPNLKMSNDDC
jgi:hypothetical protein